MRKNVLMSAAVAAVLASGAASAANIDIYVSGSSALRSFFAADLALKICNTGNTANVASATYLDTTYTTYAPDYTAFQCTVASLATGNSGAGVAVGDVVTLHYAAELGSVWGVFGAYSTTSTRLYLDPSAAACPAGNYTVPGKSVTQAGSVWPTVTKTSYCTGTGFNHVTDSDTAGPLTAHTADVVVSDVEPAMFPGPLNASFSGPENWPTSNFDATTIPNALLTPPTPAQITAATNLMKPMLGQVFGFIAHGLPGVADTAGTGTNPAFSLSQASLRSILNGTYTKWAAVPELAALDTTGTGTAISICRRDHGSGTEVSASLTVMGAECGVAGAQTVVSGTTSNPATVGGVYEAPATADMKACVSAKAGTIGIIGSPATDAAFSYTVLNIAGQQPTSHSAASGSYPYAYEAWAGVTGLAGVGKLPGAKLIADAKEWTQLIAVHIADETAVLTNGLYTAAAPKAFYAIQGNSGTTVAGVNNNTRSAAQMKADLLPASLFTRSGDSCALRTNTNN